MKTLIPLTPTIEWIDNQVKMIDQTKLPLEEKYIQTDEYKVVCDAIYRLSIRGAPAIGVSGAFGMALAALQSSSKNSLKRVLASLKSKS